VIRLLIVDDHAIVRSGLRLLLESEEDIECVGEAGSAEEAVRLARREQPDVVLLDVVMPGRSGIEATPDILAAAPEAHEVSAGGRYVHPTLGARLVVADQQARARAEADPLSEREREVLRLLALGHTNQEIAKMLYISVRTAETHRAHIMQKLRLSTRAELVRYAIANDLLEE
jgi:two-component system response regulator NreC